MIKKVIGNSFVTYANGAITFIFFSVSSRLLDIQMFSQFALLIAVTAFIYAITDFGFSRRVLAVSVNNSYESQIVASHTLLRTNIFLLFATPIFFVIAICNEFNLSYVFAFVLFYSYPYALTQANTIVSIHNFNITTSLVVTLVRMLFLSLGLLLIFLQSQSIEPLWELLFLAFFTFFIPLYLFRNIYKLKFFAKSSFENIRKYLLDPVYTPFALISIVEAVSRYADSFIIYWLTSTVDYVDYSVALRIYHFVIPLIAVFSISRSKDIFISANKENGHRNFLANYIFHSFIYASLISLVLYFLAPYIVSLVYGKASDSITSIVRAFILPLFFMAIASPFVQYALFGKFQSQVAKIHILASFLAVISGPFLVILFGVYGGVAVQLLIEITILLVSSFVLYRNQVFEKS